MLDADELESFTQTITEIHKSTEQLSHLMCKKAHFRNQSKQVNLSILEVPLKG